MNNTNLEKEKTKNIHSNGINDYVVLTTIDNPFNPFENFDSWFLFDVQKGYNSCNYLSRILDLKLDKINYELTENEMNVLVESAIDEILEYDPLGLYKKMYNPNYGY